MDRPSSDEPSPPSNHVVAQDHVHDMVHLAIGQVKTGSTGVSTKVVVGPTSERVEGRNPRWENEHESAMHRRCAWDA